MDLQWEQDVLEKCKQIVWIGCNDGLVQKDFKKKTIQIANYYEFNHNIEYRWNTAKIGYAARSETRKCFHFLDKHKGYAITDWMGYENLKEGLNLDLKKVKVLTALIWLNMSPLHDYKMGEFLYYFGRLNLYKSLKK